MRRFALDYYRCPYTGGPLKLEAAAGDIVAAAWLIAQDGRRFEIADGIPRLFDPASETLGEEELREHAYYQDAARDYDAVMDWVFRSFYEDEDVVRSKMIDLLDLKPGGRVLEPAYSKSAPSRCSTSARSVRSRTAAWCRRASSVGPTAFGFITTASSGPSGCRT